ncbi:MAG TPA: hypothetical protein VGI34_03190, partial [Candidatus Acidoferrales bacterium]
QLLPRLVFSRGFDYWESGMDLYPGHDMYDCFCSYQAALLKEFDQLAEEYKFETVDASADAKDVCDHLKTRILGILKPAPSQAVASNSQSELIEALMKKLTGKLNSDRNNVGEYTKRKTEMVVPLAAHSSNGNGRAAH